MFSLVSGAFCFVISHPGDAPEFRILSSHGATFWNLFRFPFFQVSRFVFFLNHDYDIIPAK